MCVGGGGGGGVDGQVCHSYHVGYLVGISCLNFAIIFSVGDSIFAIDLARFTPGRHSLDITISSDFGQDLIVPTLSFSIPGI